jgi:hypothetical protein
MIKTGLKSIFAKDKYVFSDFPKQPRHTFSYVNSEKPQRQLGTFSVDAPALTGSSSVER